MNTPKSSLLLKTMKTHLIMRTLFLLLPLLALCLALSNPIAAQDYRTALGARLGSPLAISLKHVINDSGHAVEAYAGYRNRSWGSWFSLSGAYLVHKPLNIEGLDGLYYYFGGGATVLFWNYSRSFNFPEEYANTAFSIQGYLGLDYTFKDVPVNLSADWIPTVFVNGYGRGFGAGYGTLAVRYVLN